MTDFGRRRLLHAAGGTVTASLISGSARTAAAQQAYDGWMEDVPNYDATHDFRGQKEVTVAVGANEGLQFEPAAILVDPGTTVVWEWTGQGGSHNVVAPDAPIDSGLTAETGHTYTHTFTDVEKRVIRYKCSPHETVGMKGAVAVGDIDDNLVSGETDASQSITDYLMLGLAMLMGFGFLAPLLYIARRQNVSGSE